MALPRTHRPRAASAGVLVLVLVLVGGCSGDSDPAPAAPTSDGAGRDVPTEVEADGLPADFPRDEVPVIDGEIVSVQEPTNENGAFSLLVYVGDTPRRVVVEQAVAQLEDAGWSLTTSVEGDPPEAQLLRKTGGAATQVILTNSFQRNESAISYTVQVTD